MEQPLNVIEFFKTIWKWKKPVLIVTVAGIIGSIVISDPHIMPPYYESRSLFYPLNPNMTSSGVLFSGAENYLFGGTNDVDRILSIAGSAPLMLHMVRKFGLFTHYEIDSARERYPVYAVLNELEDNYRYEKNDRGAVDIIIQDRDRQMAADMVNEVVNRIDQTNRELLNENKKKILAIYARKLQEKEDEVRKLTDSIFRIKQEFSLYTDIEDLPAQIQRTRASRGSEYDAASERVKVLEEKKKGAIRELNNNTVQYEQYHASITDDVPTLFILERAYPAEKKSKPVRWLIVLATALVSFGLSSIAVVLIERFKHIKAVFRNV